MYLLQGHPEFGTILEQVFDVILGEVELVEDGHLLENVARGVGVFL